MKSSTGRRSFLKRSGRWALALSTALQVRDAWPVDARGTDYAESRFVDMWLRHPVFGEPSFDSFERRPGNPILTGAPPYGWPVNGFLFFDPVSGNWYIYVGDYATGYLGPPPSRCLLYRSTNRGQSWENLGAVVEGDAAMFDRNGHTPDVSVVHDGRLYHMVYDWCTNEFVNRGGVPYSREGGLAHAWSEKPEGPWHRDPQPITFNSTLTPLLGKYQRTYAASLLRRRRDWLILGMMDAAPWSWALFAMSAPNPQGPYSERKLVRHVEGPYYHPPLLEFYPAFSDGDSVYATATSVARNRDFQVMFRAPLEQATEESAWKIYRHGSVWHSEDVPNETYGLWGQTFSGSIDRDRRLWAMFPSRNRQGLGTINMASRPWAQPLRARGFRLSGHDAPSLTCLRHSYSDFTLDAELRVSGTARIIWNYHAPLGPDKPVSDAKLHPLSLARHQGLELGDQWSLVTLDAGGARQVVASGSARSNGAWNVSVQRKANGATVLALDGKAVWTGTMEPDQGAIGKFDQGAIGLLASPHSHVSVDRFAIAGQPLPGKLSYLYTEGWLGAGENPANWVEQTDPAFRFRVGAVRRAEGGRVKWNFLGSGFTLWSPKGPDYGVVEARLDGELVGTLELKAPESRPSQPLLHKTGLPDTFHALSLEPRGGRLVVDSLDVHS